MVTPHRPIRYSLFLGDLRIGIVNLEDSDFPNVWGQITFDRSLSQPATAGAVRLARFIDLNRESIRLVDVEHEQDVSAELDAVNRELEKYSDYIETDDWRLVDDQGAQHPILCPIFRHGGEIVWRWNPGR